MRGDRQAGRGRVGKGWQVITYKGEGRHKHRTLQRGITRNRMELLTVWWKTGRQGGEGKGCTHMGKRRQVGFKLPLS